MHESTKKKKKYTQKSEKMDRNEKCEEKLLSILTLVKRHSKIIFK